MKRAHRIKSSSPLPLSQFLSQSHIMHMGTNVFIFTDPSFLRRFSFTLLLPLSFSASLCPSLSLSLPLSVSLDALCLCLSHLLPLCLCLYISVSLYMSLYVSMSLCLCLSLSISLSLSRHYFTIDHDHYPSRYVTFDLLVSIQWWLQYDGWWDDNEWFKPDFKHLSRLVSRQMDFILIPPPPPSRSNREHPDETSSRVMPTFKGNR